MTTVEIEVKNTLYVCMTSGVKGPEIELTDEEVSKINELVSQLDTPWEGSNFFGMGLSSDHFMVNIITSDYSIYIDTNMCGYVKFSKLEPNIALSYSSLEEYKDTVGLWGYLAPIGQRAYLQWIEKQKQYSKEYAEKAAQGVPGYIDFTKEYYDTLGWNKPRE